MGHGHSHGSHAAVEVGQRARTILIGFLALLGVLAIAGMIWLWPTGSQVSGALNRIAEPEGTSYHNGTITRIVDGCESMVETDAGSAPCATLTVALDSGEEAGSEVAIEHMGPLVVKTGDSIEVAKLDTPDGSFYSFSGINRLPVLAVMLALFVVAVLAVARLKGLMAIVGLVVAGWVLLGFMLPAILVGKPGMAVALAGSTVIMFIVLYVAHGVSLRTSAALAGTLLGLAVTTSLGAIAVGAARLGGFAEETEYDLAQLAPSINFQELLMVGIIIGGLGVLNDVTITQASAVWELRAAAPQWSRMEVFRAGMRIGRDHIASTIYTIVFAYAGSALAVLMLLYFTARDPLSLFGVEMFASEGVRTLASAIGLVLSVPITTGIAAVTLGPGREPFVDVPQHAAPEPVGD